VLSDKLTKKQHLRFKACIYLVLVFVIAHTGVDQYRTWIKAQEIQVEQSPEFYDDQTPETEEGDAESTLDT